MKLGEIDPKKVKIAEETANKHLLPTVSEWNWFRGSECIDYNNGQICAIEVMTEIISDVYRKSKNAEAFAENMAAFIKERKTFCDHVQIHRKEMT
jgi:hypothetical protein